LRFMTRLTIVGDLDLSNVGNIPGSFELELGRVRPEEKRIVGPDGCAILKSYVLERAAASPGAPNAPYTPEAISRIREFIAGDLLSLKQRGTTGLGFSIISPGIVNISMWGGELPMLVNQNIYEVSKDEANPLSKIRRLSPGEDGAYCAREGRIVGHESGAWMHFLRSGRTSDDVAAYLINVFEGEI
jgi:hypothetical protein